MIEDKLVGWHHQLSGHEFETAPGNCEYCKHSFEGSCVNIIYLFYWVDTIAILYDCCCCKELTHWKRP